MRCCRLLSAGRTCICIDSRSAAESTECIATGVRVFSSDARNVRLCDLKLRRLERCVYEYDFGDLWVHDVRLEATLAADLKRTYPVCVAGKCAAPPEDCGGPHAFMANRRRYCARGSAQAWEDLDERGEELDEEESVTG